MNTTQGIAFVLALGTGLSIFHPLRAQENPPPVADRTSQDPFLPPIPTPPGAERDLQPTTSPEVVPGNPMGGGPGGPGGRMGGGPPGYDVTWYPARAVQGQAANLGFVRQGLNLGAPIWREGGDMVIASVGIRHTLFSTDALLPESRAPFPEQLWNLNLGMNYRHRFDNGWSVMGIASVGSASDKPFHSIREVTATLGGFLTLPAANQRDSWQVGAIYMAGGAVNFPLPIVSYNWNPSERFRMSLGLPLSLTWKPTEEWTMDLAYTPLLNINAKLTYQLSPPIKLYGGYEFLNESYFLADRVDRNERFFGFEQRLITGLRWECGKHATLDGYGGYSFGRYYGSGDSQFGTLRDQVDVASGAFLGLNLRMRF